MLLDGRGILERNASGEVITGNTLLVLFNGSAAEQAFTMPTWREGRSWTRLIDTAEPDEPAAVGVGSGWTLAPRSSSIWQLTF